MSSGAPPPASVPSGPARTSALGVPVGAQLADFALILVLSGAAVAAVGLFRLTRQFPSAGESPSLLVPFLLPVVALSLEAGALLALSVSQARGLLRSEDGLVRRARSTTATLVFALGVLVAVQLLPRGTERPGAFANELIRTAVASCAGGGAGADVAVPLLGLQVRCTEPSRIVGPMPGVRSVRIAMRGLSFSDDLRRVEIEELELIAQRSLSVRLRTGRASVAGLAPWSRSTRLGERERLAVLGLLAVALWSSGVVMGARRGSDVTPRARRPWRWAGWLVAGLPGLVAAAGFIVVDQGQGTPWAYGVPGALGVLGMALLRLLTRRLPQMFSSFSGF